jgi:hypothetical protein
MDSLDYVETMSKEKGGRFMLSLDSYRYFILNFFSLLQLELILLKYYLNHHVFITIKRLNHVVMKLNTTIYLHYT